MDCPNTGGAKRTDRSTIEYDETYEFFLFVDVSFSSRSSHRRELPIEYSKITCSAKVNKSAWFPSSEIDDRSWLLSVIVRIGLASASSFSHSNAILVLNNLGVGS